MYGRLICADALDDANKALELDADSSRAKERIATALFKLGLTHAAVAASGKGGAPLPGASQVAAALQGACSVLPEGTLASPSTLFSTTTEKKCHLDDAAATTGAALGTTPDSFVLRSAHAAVLAATGRLALAAQHALHACATVLRNKQLWASCVQLPAALVPGGGDTPLEGGAAQLWVAFHKHTTPFYLLGMILAAAGQLDGVQAVIDAGTSVQGGSAAAAAGSSEDSDTPAGALLAAVHACISSKTDADALYKTGKFDEALAAYLGAAGTMAAATGFKPVTLLTNAAAAAAAAGGVLNATASFKAAVEAAHIYPYLAKAWQRVGSAAQSQGGTSAAKAFAAYGAAQALQPSNVAVSSALQPLHKGITSDPVAHINSEEEWGALIQRLKKQGTRRILVDYFAVWCGPCKAIAPYVSELAAAYHPGTLAFAKVDGDKCQDLIMEAGVRAFPTFHVYDVQSGSKVDELQGAAQAELQKLAYRAAIGGATAMAGAHLSPVPAAETGGAAQALQLPSKSTKWLQDAVAESAVSCASLAAAAATM